MTGWSWEQVDDLTLPRLRTLFGYWGRHPHIHRLACAYFGIGQDEAPKKQATKDDIRRFASSLGVS